MDSSSDAFFVSGGRGGKGAACCGAAGANVVLKAKMVAKVHAVPTAASSGRSSSFNFDIIAFGIRT